MNTVSTEVTETMSIAAKRRACAISNIGAPANAGAMQDGAKHDGRFKPGRGGNPAGKPKGTRNRAAAILDEISDADLQQVVAKVVELAKGGDLVAAKMILPAPRARNVEVGLVEVGRHDGNEAILASFGAIVRAVAEGQINPTEALALTELLDRQRDAIALTAPARLKPEPSPEEADRQRRADEASARLADRLIGAIGGP
jgi:Family of unknown function (DUF5681)